MWYGKTPPGQKHIADAYASYTSGWDNWSKGPHYKAVKSLYDLFIPK